MSAVEDSKEGVGFSLKKTSSNTGGFVEPGQEYKLDGWKLRSDGAERICILVLGQQAHQTGPIKEIALPFA
jgi:hypothetical protein